MKNGRTIDEWNTVAMLLGPGWWYDWHDHTICFDHAVNGRAGVDMYEPETMKSFEDWAGPISEDRFEKVRSGEIGASDVQQYLKRKREEVSDNREDVTTEGNADV